MSLVLFCYNRPLLSDSMSVGVCVQARREGRVRGKLPRARDVRGALPSLKHSKYTKMRYFKRKI